MTTQFARASYQEIVDLHTESDTVSVIGIHTPQGDTPRKMFGGFFEQFKKFKYLGCSIKLVPAARLPADPLQVSYDAGETTIDPRDMLNPLMFHGCHGNDMGVILNRLYSLNSIDGRKSDSIVMEQDDVEWSLEGILSGDVPNFQLEDLYYKALTDNTWKKAHPQRGFRKSGLRPLVYKMSTNMQMLGSGQSLIGVDGLGIPGRMIENDGDFSLPVVQSGRQFFTPGLTGLGWLDTRNVLTTAIDVDFDGSDYDDLDDAIPALESAIRTATLAQQDASESSLPLVYMGMILLPPAYKTEQYFRMIINHHFAFKDFRGISFSNNLAVTPAYDNFNADATDDPDDPDPPSPPEPGPDDPDDPVGAALELVGMYAQGVSYATAVSLSGSLTGVTYAKFYDAEGVEYEPTLTIDGTIRSLNFLIDSQSVSGGNFPIGYYAVADGNSAGFKFSTNVGGVYDYADIVCMIGYNVVTYRVKGTTTWKTAGSGATFGISPTNDSLPFGKSDEFSGVTFDVS